MQFPLNCSLILINYLYSPSRKARIAPLSWPFSLYPFFTIRKQSACLCLQMASLSLDAGSLLRLGCPRLSSAGSAERADPLSHDAHDLHRISVIPVGNSNSRTLRRSMNNLTISNIHGYMVNVAFASIEKKISRLHLVCAHLLSLKGLAGG